MNSHRTSHKTVFLLLSLLLPLAAGATVRSWSGDVSVEVVAPDGRVFSQYPTHGPQRRNVYRNYLLAYAGADYGIRVRNNTGRHIGVVVAVDGRNIVSGHKSHLASGERMYVLDPYQQATFEGWRTSRNQVNRFYFTESEDSYAGTFGDRSAMGVIALAVYRERYVEQRRRELSERFNRPAPAKEDAKRAPRSAQESADALSQPGTGFGEETRSPVRLVRFRPEARAASRYFIKYEWRQTLCAKGVIRCGEPANRFWPDSADDWAGSGDYAPYPPEQVY
ncbi:MAG: hypothetical protein DRQ37_07125 [Gammaproteobacteria bacterium]|nr:MAG: hypothetical protein DRQ37_07125 [Gammaproteobacteria bacterium]